MLTTPESNPRLAQYVRVFFALASLIVLVGTGLYLAPGLVVPRWLWPLTPFNANFLGAIYLTELLAASMLVWYNRWSPARVALPMSYVFTGVVTVVTLFYLDHFDFTRWASYFWFLIYIGSVLVALIAHWQYRRLPVPNPVALSAAFRAYLRGQGIAQGLYGLALLAAPAVAAGFWPWKIDDFHGRVYSSVFFSGAVAALLVARGASQLDLRLLGVAQAGLGLLPILGLMIVDVAAQRVNYAAPGTWVWLLGFATLFVAGTYMLRQSLAPAAVPLLNAPSNAGSRARDAI